MGVTYREDRGGRDERSRNQTSNQARRETRGDRERRRGRAREDERRDRNRRDQERAREADRRQRDRGDRDWCGDRSNPRHHWRNDDDRLIPFSSPPRYCHPSAYYTSRVRDPFLRASG